MSNLFGENEEVIKEEPKPRATYNADPALETVHWDFVSLLYKSIRIGDAQTACVCANVIKQIKGEYRVVLILNQIVGEDVHPLYYSELLPVVQSYTTLFHSKIEKWHNLSQITYLLAKAPKWYMDSMTKRFTHTDFYSGEELERIRQYVATEINIENKEGLKKFCSEYKFPTFVYDQHTRKGLAMKKLGTADLRLDGGWENRFNVKNRFDNVAKKLPTSSYDYILEEYRKELYTKPLV